LVSDTALKETSAQQFLAGDVRGKRGLPQPKSRFNMERRGANYEKGKKKLKVSQKKEPLHMEAMARLGFLSEETTTNYLLYQLGRVAQEVASRGKG